MYHLGRKRYIFWYLSSAGSDLSRRRCGHMADCPLDHQTAFDHARKLVLAYGFNPSAYQILNPGIQLWFSDAGDAVVGYVDRPGVRVVAGNPVAALHRLKDTAEQFEAATAKRSLRVCYLGADELFGGLYNESSGYSQLVIGAQPIVNPMRWGHIIGGHPSLRAQLNRARNKSVEVHQWFAKHATDHPALRRCLAAWLSTKGLPPLHFLVEPDTLGQLHDRQVFVAQMGGTVIGFLVASPIPLRHGWQIEQLVRGPEAPNGTMELLLDGAVRSFAAHAVEYVALGAAPLSERVALGEDTPTRLRAMLRWQRAHARRFYNFEGLERFKAKFDPVRWEPVLAISAERRFSVRTMYAIAGAYCGGSPMGAFTKAIARAGRQELVWLWRRVRSGFNTSS